MFKTEHSTYLLWFELIDLLCVRLYRIFAPSNFCNLSLSMASRCSFLSFYTIKAVGKVGGEGNRKYSAGIYFIDFYIDIVN